LSLREPSRQTARPVALPHHRIAIAVLRRDVHLHRHPDPLLDRVPAEQAGVVIGQPAIDGRTSTFGERALPSVLVASAPMNSGPLDVVVGSPHVPLEPRNGAGMRVHQLFGRVTAGRRAGARAVDDAARAELGASHG
jgi:hypothetical protein